MHLTQYKYCHCSAAVTAQAAGKREAKWVDRLQRKVQGALRVAHQHGEQGVPKRRHQHRRDDREASQGKRRSKFWIVDFWFSFCHFQTFGCTAASDAPFIHSLYTLPQLKSLCCWDWLGENLGGGYVAAEEVEVAHFNKSIFR